MPEIEKEFKNLLTKEQYDALVNDYKEVFTKDVTQTNSYYDYEGLLQEHKNGASHSHRRKEKKPVKSH